MKRLVLIDGHAILHRAYHALPPTFTNKEGISTNAVYGFTTMLLRILSDLKPDFLAVAFDRPEPNFRQQQYTAYQGKRPEMEGNLSDQIPLVHELLDELKIPYFEVAGFEADDILGSLAAQATQLSVFGSRLSDSGLSVVGSSETEKPKTGKLNSDNRKQRTDNRIETVIVTGDRDMLQLVNSHVKVCVPVKGLAETKIYDEKLIEEEFRVKPSQWVDVKALKGDASDNYSGVQGIGPKTAQELVAKYGTLEGIYRNLSELETKTAKKLAEGAEDAGLGKKLAQIVTDVPVHLDLERAAIMGIDWNCGIKYMREKLGFKSLPERIEREFSGQIPLL